MTSKTSTDLEGWSIRNYQAGDYYADIYCPHGQPVEVINTNGETLQSTVTDLRAWLLEVAEWRHNYCDGHR